MLFGEEIQNNYLRGRIEALRHLYMIEKDERGKRYLRMGTDLYKPQELQELTASFAKTYSNEPLNFTELTSFNTWFKLHPEKVAGTEKLTTSLHFPVTIKGTRQDVEKVLKIGNQQKPDLELMEAEALAELELLNLLNL